MKNCVIQFRKTVFLLVLVGLLCSPLIVSAESGTKKYAGFYLDYTCTVSSTKGTATTIGAQKPYSNYALIIVYDKNGKSKGSAVNYGLPTAIQSSAKATATVAGKIGLQKAVGNHAVANSSKNLIGSYDELIVTRPSR